MWSPGALWAMSDENWRVARPIRCEVSCWWSSYPTSSLLGKWSLIVHCDDSEAPIFGAADRWDYEKCISACSSSQWERGAFFERWSNVKWRLMACTTIPWFDWLFDSWISGASGTCSREWNICAANEAQVRVFLMHHLAEFYVALVVYSW